MPRSSHSASFKDTEVCVAIQRDDCPDLQASAIVMVDFSDIGRQVASPWFSPYESLECGYPGAPSFGRPHPVKESYRPGDAVSFTCAHGHSLQGPLQRVCLFNGTWAGQLPLCGESLDIIGHWNAKRSSVPYLVYWALDVDCLRWRSCILIGGHGRRMWEGENWWFQRSQKNSMSKFVQADEKLVCYWSSGICEQELYSLSWCQVGN
ncbi:uncharacterized protein TNCV_2677441 [Trichonephila clavipes]|nr:uncharacterized protein TNCV_2677441 [Trichonephila clavipes]